MEEGVSVSVYTCNHCTWGYKQEDQEPMTCLSYMSELKAGWGYMRSQKLKKKKKMRRKRRQKKKK